MGNTCGAGSGCGGDHGLFVDFDTPFGLVAAKTPPVPTPPRYAALTRPGLPSVGGAAVRPGDLADLAAAVLARVTAAMGGGAAARAASAPPPPFDECPHFARWRR